MTEVLTCGGCGDSVATRDQEGRGPCCRNLPDPWTRGVEGLYNSTDAYHAPEPEEEEPERAHCLHCESTKFRVSGTLVASTDEEGGDTIFYDSSDFELTVECSGCGRSPRNLDLEHM